MLRITVNILLVMCFALPSWARREYESTNSIEFSRRYEVLSTLDVFVEDSDTIWSIGIIGRYLDEETLLLIKTCDGKVVEYEPSNYHAMKITEEYSTNPITGEVYASKWYYEHSFQYHITKTALLYFIEHGISKIRLGTENKWHEKIWQHNEWGKLITEAYNKLLIRLAPDYVPPKRPTIRDGF